MAYTISKKLNIRPQYNSPVVVHVSSGDSGIPITFEMYDGNEAFEIPSGSVISVHGTRKDGVSWIATATASSNEVTFTSPSAMAAVEGAGIAEVSITSGTETVGSANFLVLVEQATIPNGVTYSNDPSVFQDILNYVKSGIAVGMAEATAGAVAEWLEENISATTPPVDKTLSVENAAGDAKIIGSTVSGLQNYSDSQGNASRYGYAYYPMRGFTTTKVIQTSSGNVVTAGNNNYAFIDFAPIPKDTLYFAFPVGGWNVVFYDENFQKIDAIGADNNMTTLYGKTYENTSASYMRVGGWTSGGYAGSTLDCFVYTYHGVNAKQGYNEEIPLYENKNGDSASGTTLTSDYIYSDVPMRVYSKDTTAYKFGVVLYDANKTGIDTYYLNDMGAKKVSVPSGCYFKVYIRNAASSAVTVSNAVLDTVIIERALDNIGYLSFSGNSKVLSSAWGRVGTIDAVYAEQNLLLHCDDFGTYDYNIALYDGESAYPNEYPCLMNYAEGADYFIPKGKYYRVCVGLHSSEACDLSTWNKITIVPIETLTPETKALVSGIGKNRLMTDTDTLPSYYSSHLATKNADIRQKGETADVQFAFVTDYHYGTYNNTHNVRPVLTNIVMNTKMNMVFNGGDTWTSGNAGEIDDGEVRKRFVNGVNETIPNAPCNWYFVLGNHDNGLDYLVQGSNVTTFGPYLTTKELQETMGGNLNRYDAVYDPKSTDLSYYFDVNGVRFVVLNNDLVTEGSSESQYSTLVFLCEALLSMGDKKAVIISHKICSADGSFYNAGSLIKNVILAYNSRSNYTLATNQIARFDNCTGQVVLVVCGHTHKDYSTTLSDGTPVVVVTSTNCGAGIEQGESRTEGTYTENAFDVFSVDLDASTIYATRIGYGNDREFSIPSL